MKHIKPILFTEEEMNHWFYLENGSLYWKNPTSIRVKAGDKAGRTTPEGYQVISVMGESYQAHRLVWTMFNGYLSTDLVIDHIDWDKQNNDPSNLRAVTNKVNVNHRNPTNPKVTREPTKGMTGKKQSKETLRKLTKGMRDKCADQKSYRWVHKDGRVVIAKRYEMKEMFNLQSGSMSGLVKGIRKTVYGWRIEE